MMNYPWHFVLLRSCLGRATGAVVTTLLVVALTPASGCAGETPRPSAGSTGPGRTLRHEQAASADRPDGVRFTGTSPPQRVPTGRFTQVYTPDALEGENHPAEETLERVQLPETASYHDLRAGPVHLASFAASGSTSRLRASALGRATPASGNPQASPKAGAAVPPSGQDNLAEIGAKLSNPVSDVWALFTQFGLTFNDGDVNDGDAQVGGNILFQPVLPIPLTEDMSLITRPTVPFLFGQPVPKGQNEFNHLTGIGDTGLPLMVSPKLENWILAAGPAFTLPTSTHDKLGRRQWTMGPAVVVGYKTKDFVAGVFPQYFWRIGSRGDQGDIPDASNMQLLYFGFLNLPQAWQVGFNPTITYDDKAASGNRWNVPIGLVVAKTLHIGELPVKIQAGFEYSVVRQDDFGQEFQIKVNLIPVIPTLIGSPLFGGG